MNDLTPKWIWVKWIKRKKYVIEEFQEMGYLFELMLKSWNQVFQILVML